MSQLTSEYPYQVHLEKDRYHLIADIRQWCMQNIGIGGSWVSVVAGQGDRWCVITAFGKSSWCFKNQHDATLFTLRWV
jgi:hypothetical protein